MAVFEGSTESFDFMSEARDSRVMYSREESDMLDMAAVVRGKIVWARRTRSLGARRSAEGCRVELLICERRVRSGGGLGGGLRELWQFVGGIVRWGLKDEDLTFRL